MTEQVFAICMYNDIRAVEIRLTDDDSHIIVGDRKVYAFRVVQHINDWYWHIFSIKPFSSPFDEACSHDIQNRYSSYVLPEQTFWVACNGDVLDTSTCICESDIEVLRRFEESVLFRIQDSSNSSETHQQLPAVDNNSIPSNSVYLSATAEERDDFANTSALCLDGTSSEKDEAEKDNFDLILDGDESINGGDEGLSDDDISEMDDVECLSDDDVQEDYHACQFDFEDAHPKDDGLKMACG